MGEDHICLGSDYPFPLGEHKPGRMIEKMDLGKKQPGNCFTKMLWIGWA